MVTQGPNGFNPGSWNSGFNWHRQNLNSPATNQSHHIEAHRFQGQGLAQTKQIRLDFLEAAINFIQSPDRESENHDAKFRDIWASIDPRQVDNLMFELLTPKAETEDNYSETLAELEKEKLAAGENDQAAVIARTAKNIQSRGKFELENLLHYFNAELKRLGLQEHFALDFDTLEPIAKEFQEYRAANEGSVYNTFVEQMTELYLNRPQFNEILFFHTWFMLEAAFDKIHARSTENDDLTPRAVALEKEINLIDDNDFQVRGVDFYAGLIQVLDGFELLADVKEAAEITVEENSYMVEQPQLNDTRVDEISSLINSKRGTVRRRGERVNPRVYGYKLLGERYKSLLIQTGLTIEDFKSIKSHQRDLSYVLRNIICTVEKRNTINPALALELCQILININKPQEVLSTSS